MDFSYNGMACPQGAHGVDGFQIWRVVATVLNKQARTVDNGGPSILGVGREANTLLIAKLYMLRIVHKSLRVGHILWWDVSDGKW